ncbi:MAG: protein kinase [Pseudomonadota bacterium]
MSDDQTNKPATPTDDATVFRGDATVLRSPTITDSDTTGGPGDEPIIPQAGQFKVLKSRFVLEDRVGSGGMGSVFRAKDLRKVEARDNKPYLAVKVLNNDFKKHPEAFIALEREASKSQSLRHKNIVSIFDFDKDGDTPFITMELLEGQELSDLLKAYPSGLPQELAWPLVKGMIEGLAHAHAEGVVHADFKPGNIYVTHNNEARILDFGIARAMRMNHGEEDTDFDPAKLAALTPAYASREMLQGDNPEVRDDIYALGVVIYMIFTGTHPYGRMPATDASREGLQPDRVKSLTRSQWRTLERCLSFNRKDRPENAQQILDGFFARASWKNITLASAAAAVLLAGGLFTSAYTQQNNINSVKAEVRTETLMYAQIQRISDLLENPRFDAEWNQMLSSELQTLRTVAPRSPAYDAMLGRINDTFGQEIANKGNLDEAFGLYLGGIQYGFTDELAITLEAQLLESLENRARTPLNADWLKAVESELSYHQRFFPKSSVLAAVRQEVLEHLASEIQRIQSVDDEVLVRVAEQAWNTFAPEMFDATTYEKTAAAIANVVKQANNQEAHRALRRLERQVDEQIGQILNVSCLRLDLDLLAAELKQIARRAPSLDRKFKQVSVDKVAGCVKRLGALDPDRALSFQRQAIVHFGRAPELLRTGIDPCSMQYLVGNGATPGPGGSCVDVVGDSVSAHAEVPKGPKLVVLSDGAQKYAISKYEISWKDVASFCGANQSCAEVNWPSQDHFELPVTGLPVEIVEAYAAWLSDQTGYIYRLPTQEEWANAVGVEVDPNRNCRVEFAGVRRGGKALAIDAGKVNSAGLVHALGNVQELVRLEAGDYGAVGGTYQDPIELCRAGTLRQVSLDGDQLTGFRLVREVS